MKPIVVDRSGYLTKLAAVHGFDADHVWNHPSNKELKKRRKDPNMLCSGDILHIPDEGDAPSAWASVSAGSTKTFQAHVPTVEVKVRLLGYDGKALADTKCEVEPKIDDEPHQTDGDGLLPLKVRTSVTDVTITPLREGGEEPLPSIVVRVGGMDPIAEESGVRMRLANLGFPTDPEADGHELGQHGRGLDGALDAFRRAYGLSPDDDVLAKLAELHGC